MVSVSEIDFGENPCLARGVKEIGGEGEWVAVLLGDFVEGAIIHTQPERAVLLADE